MRLFLIIFFSIVFLILASLISLFFWLRSGAKTLTRSYFPHEKVKGNALRQALILYQPSIHQTSETFANTVMDTFLSLGYKVTSNYIDHACSYDINKYDIIAFGSPVYVGHISPKFEEYVKSHDIRRKKIILYSMGTIQKEKHEFDAVKSILKKQNRVYKIKVLPNPSGKQKLISFIKNVY